MDESRIKLGGPPVTLIAVIAPGGAVATAGVAWILSPGKKAIIKKITAINRTVANGFLLIGYGDTTPAGSLFREARPRILLPAGIEVNMTEEELPICGNTRQGFAADATVTTGSNGNILVGTTAVGVAAPTPVEVQIEVEEK